MIEVLLFDGSEGGGPLNTGWIFGYSAGVLTAMPPICDDVELSAGGRGRGIDEFRYGRLVVADGGTNGLDVTFVCSTWVDADDGFEFKYVFCDTDWSKRYRFVLSLCQIREMISCIIPVPFVTIEDDWEWYCSWFTDEVGEWEEGRDEELCGG